MPRYDDSQFSPAAPVAVVTLRIPDNDGPGIEVPLLIDSGADVTLLPQASVVSLGIEANAGEVYELVGFDGNISTSTAVRVDLVFGRKTFKGRFLLIDQAWGVLGRDVLNHLCLVLDGPRQTWDERKTFDHA
jgi:hypothetical protein